MKNNPVLVRNEEQEQTQVRRDLIFVVTMNLLFFAALVGLYFYNRATGQVDSFFARFLNF